MLVIMHYALFISHYAVFGTHSKLSNFWVASDSLWVEPLLGRTVQIVTTGTCSNHMNCTIFVTLETEGKIAILLEYNDDPRSGGRQNNCIQVQHFSEWIFPKQTKTQRHDIAIAVLERKVKFNKGDRVHPAIWTICLPSPGQVERQ